MKYDLVMLAKVYDGHDPSGWWISEKLDGVRLFWTGTGFSDSERACPPSFGAIVTVSCMGLTTGGMPRFPVFQCVRMDREDSHAHYLS